MFLLDDMKFKICFIKFLLEKGKGKNLNSELFFNLLITFIWTFIHIIRKEIFFRWRFIAFNVHIFLKYFFNLLIPGVCTYLRQRALLCFAESCPGPRHYSPRTLVLEPKTKGVLIFFRWFPAVNSRIIICPIPGLQPFFES